MKSLKLGFVFTFILFINNLFAQEKVERYCKIISFSDWSADHIQHKTLITYSNSHLQLDFGMKESFSKLKENNVIVDLEKVKELTDEIDALNYMKDIGWELLNIVPEKNLEYGKTDRKIFYFKKSFEKQVLH